MTGIYFHCTTAYLAPILEQGLIARSPAHCSSVYHDQENLHAQPQGVYCCKNLEGTARWGADIMAHGQWRDLTVVAFVSGQAPVHDEHDPAGQALRFDHSIDPDAIVTTQTVTLQALKAYAETQGQDGWTIVENMRWYGPFIAKWLQGELKDFCLNTTNVQNISVASVEGRCI